MGSPIESTYIGETVMPKRDKKPRYWVKQDGTLYQVWFGDRLVRYGYTIRSAAVTFADHANKTINDPTSNSEE